MGEEPSRVFNVGGLGVDIIKNSQLLSKEELTKKTKIIATIGPSSNHSSVIAQLIRKGMNVARINMAHQFDDKKLKKLIKDIRLQSKKFNKYIGILMDIAGPKIRVDLSNIGNEEIEIIHPEVLLYQMLVLIVQRIKVFESNVLTQLHFRLIRRGPQY